MAETVDADPADQIDVSVAVDVLDHRPLRALDGDAGGEREALKAGCKVPLLVLHQAARSRSGNFRLDVRGFERHFLAFRSRSGAFDSRPAAPVGGHV